jgi:hypothetical protein
LEVVQFLLYQGINPKKGKNWVEKWILSSHTRDFTSKPLLWRRFAPPWRGLVKLDFISPFLLDSGIHHLCTHLKTHLKTPWQTPSPWVLRVRIRSVGSGLGRAHPTSGSGISGPNAGYPAGFWAVFGAT